MSLSSRIKAFFAGPEERFQGELEDALIKFTNLMKEPSNFVTVEGVQQFKDKGTSRDALRRDLRVQDLILAMDERGYNYINIVRTYRYEKYLDDYDKVMGSGPNRQIKRYL